MSIGGSIDRGMRGCMMMHAPTLCFFKDSDSVQHILKTVSIAKADLATCTLALARLSFPQLVDAGSLFSRLGCWIRETIHSLDCY